MQNAECKMQNFGISFGNNSIVMCKAHTNILHYAF